MHTYYITNAKTELKFAYNDLNDDQFQTAMQEALYEAKHNDEFGSDGSDESDEFDEFDEYDE